MDIIIETPKGSTAKFDFNPEKGMFELGKVLPAGLAFPHDFGYIPGTKGGDGDPLDALVISEFQTFTGCLLNCRLIGGMKALQTDQQGKSVRNDRLIAIPEVSVQFAKIRSIGQLSLAAKKQLQQFFENYNQQEGRLFEVQKWLSAKEATAMAKAALQEKTEPGWLIQLFLPLNNPKGKPHATKHFAALKKQLTDQFGGLSMFSQSPVSGVWENEDGQKEKDHTIIFEVMTDYIDPSYWKNLRQTLEKEFEQTQILIRQLAIGLL